MIKQVGIIGSGTMGRGIAVASAVSGHEVVLCDIEAHLIESAAAWIAGTIDKGVQLGKTDPAIAKRAKVATRTTVDLQETSSCDLVIEAIPESLELKRDLFSRLDRIVKEDAILASNTSSLSISVLAGATRRPDRFIGLHFFNPAHIMRLVEIVKGDDTSEDTLEASSEFVANLGKTAAVCKDTPAFIVNRVARPFYGEALRLLGENVASIEVIDDLVRSTGFKMGPFQLIDLVGCDVNLAVTKSVYEAYFHDPKYRPHLIQQRMVDSGRLGRKSGRGFYSYDEP